MNYYDELGLSNNATIDEIKSAYKKLALQFHPDKNKSPDAEERFKKIAQSYQILSDKDSKRTYDMTGKIDGVVIDLEFAKRLFQHLFPNNQQLFGKIETVIDNINEGQSIIPTLNTILSDIMITQLDNFNTYLKKQRKRSASVPDISISESEPEIEASSTNSSLQYDSEGEQQDSSADLYYKINISLNDIYNNKSKQIYIKLSRKCKYCITNRQDCIRCDNKKYIISNIAFNINLTKKTIRFKNKAHDLPGYKQPGDVICIINILKHAIFKRKDKYDLIMYKTINPYELYYGCEFNYTHLDNKQYQVVSHADIFSNQIQIIKNKGLCRGGDLYIQYVLAPVDEEAKQSLYNTFCNFF